MVIKLEVVSREVINYTGAKGAASFAVLNCREAFPATVLRPIRLSADAFPSLKPGDVAAVSLSDATDAKRGTGSVFLSMRGTLVNGK